ncbi:hypothetical protein [Dyadobacter sp. CY356]|uniref:hypothetical protein n=1 Tax=Dyadobacter sp. CY356 TaxID=2906442 RepID=UPI001F1F6561|nr:hypothetical protein [Dyadobacter sp. CY356]MCF0054507.1 hypothetical protein [Dyadobacter sp. CY356]
MSVDKYSLQNEIVEAVTSRLESSMVLSDKAKNRIAKSGGKLAERLMMIFEKQERKAAKKAAESGSDPDDFSEETSGES